MADNLTDPAGNKWRTKDTGANGHISKIGIRDDADTDALGLVAAAPDPLTLLGRLKTIADSVALVGGYTDGLETLIGSLNGYVDQVEALIASTNGYVDGLEGLLAKGAKTTANALAVSIASDQAAVPTDCVIKGVATDKGGTIATAATAQVLMVANAARRGFRVQNQSAGDLFINELGAAVADKTSLKIPAGAYYESPPHYCPTGAISIIGATAGQAFYAREF